MTAETSTLPDTLRLPAIPLDRLSERTKDFLLGRASDLKCSPDDLIVALLDRGAGVQPETPAVQLPAIAA